MKRLNTITQALNSGVAQLDVGDQLTANLPLAGHENPPITVDTSVGTRVFVGDTMIHGDTGLRDIRSLYLGSPSDANIQVLELLRYGRTVRLYGTIANDAAISELTQINLFSAPYGFRTGGYWTRGAGRDLLLGAPGDTRTMRLQTESGRTFGQLGGSVVMFEMEWVTPNPWPTTEPGTPA